MIAVLVLPPLLAVGWFGWERLRREVPQPVPYLFSAPTGRALHDTVFDLPTSSAPAANPPKP